jgi:abhydrolase domain-containing protein 6
MDADGINPFFMDDVSAFDAFYAMTMQRPPFVPGFVRRAIGASYVARRDRLETIYRDFHGRDLLEHDLDRITSPTWVAWGRHDQIISATAAQAWADGIPDCQLTIYDDLGHMPMLEAPGRVAADYLAFLEEVEADPS